MKQILILIAFLIFASLANAQTDTVKLRKQIEAEIMNKVAQDLAERPIYIMAGSDHKGSKQQLYFIKGWLKNGLILDSHKAPLPDWVVVFGTMVRKEEKGK